MRYLELKRRFEPFIVFSLTEIRKVEPDFDVRRLVEWQEKGYIKKIIREYYIFADYPVTDLTLYYVANTIYAPSYISLEMGLSYHQIIPESVYVSTSIATKKTQEFVTPLGRFQYRSIKPALMFGYQWLNYEHVKVKVGELEKVIMDYFYLHAEIDGVESVAGLRFNQEVLRNNLDLEKLKNYLTLFDNQALVQRLGYLEEYLEI